MILNAVDGEERRWFAGYSEAVRSIALSPDGSQLLVGSGKAVHWTFGGPPDPGDNLHLWDFTTGVSRTPLAQNHGTVTAVAFSGDGHAAITGGEDNIAHVWDVATGVEKHSLKGHSSYITSVAFSHDGRFALTGSDDKTARLWDIESGSELKVFVGHSSGVSAVAFSHDDRMVLTGGGFNDDTAARLWNAATGAEIRRFVDNNDVYSRGAQTATFSSDDRQVLTCGSDLIWVWDAATGSKLHRFQVSDLVYSAAFSPDGHSILAGMANGTVLLLDAESGKESRRFTGHSDRVVSLEFSTDGRLLFTGSNDGTSKIWDYATGELLATAASFGDGKWAVIDPDGRFDTNDLDGGAHLVWIAESQPMQPLPLEIFMRDYYTPRLLSSILNGEVLPAVRSISEIKNRVQPDVEITAVQTSKSIPGRADVVVHSASHKSDQGQMSGIQDLRVFRDGQLVGIRPGQLHDGDFTFTGIQLPASRTSVTFTAYAFNEERIKSATSRKSYDYKPDAPAKSRAWLLQIGVNHYEASGCELHGSANDAEQLSRILTDRLKARGFDVRPVTLTSTDAAAGATKQQIREALAAIAREATPDDVLFLSFSGHGYASGTGEFYLLSSDVRGSCSAVDDKMLRGAISADELADWLRPIDAGEMTFVLDSCDSASSVEANDFKPGPMGSRGLGQLAYDKRMRILVASQKNQAARESDVLQQGLLSYALTELGLTEGKADWRPVDQKITVGEWLGYAANAVPAFIEGGVVKSTRGLIPIGQSEKKINSSQVPAVFDFSSGDTLVLQ